MQYALLIYNAPGAGPAPDSPEGQAEFAAWMSYSQELVEAGVMRGGEALHPTQAATTVRVRGGELQSADGPFAETKEVLDGFYLIEVPDLDAALAWAAKIPSVTRGSVELRPTVVFDQA
ncbi:YciI family protein [Conexibacter woesei]|uniref:YCII-related protein n=1 Tax=Conexibacter woesei (strain DSM 14684 / CCUG 47730 / CIP 108061 / JCM 11494 / NBRC 100937 / ID131577) TaxID=469383 RepID=D3F8T4_CONWI|nr:YciI family protein [Conexibacter woesei]ADB51048.1 YCII-related protein [Conexibacter woesei DSM 14684]